MIIIQKKYDKLKELIIAYNEVPYDRVTFAKINYAMVTWVEDRDGVISRDMDFGVDIFKTIDAAPSNIGLTSSVDEEGCLNVRFATIAEARNLKHWIENNQIKLSFHEKEQTNEILTNYLAGEFPPHPYSWNPAKYTLDSIMNWYLLIESEEISTNPLKIIGESN